MTVLQDIYFLTSCLGFVYVVGSSLMGTFHSHGSGAHAHGTQHTGSACAHGQASGHSAPHGAHSHCTGTHTHGSAAQTHGTGARAHGNAGHSHPATQGPQSSETRNALSISQNTSRSLRPQVPSFYLRALDILNPTKLAFFAFLFGASGMIFMRFIPGYLSMIPAVLVACLLANLFFTMLGSIFARLNSSTNFKKEYLIGSTGELSVSIEAAGVGEVVISTGNSRYTSRAKAADTQETIKKLAKVIVVDIKDDIFIVEPFNDASLLTDDEQTKS